MATTTLYIHLDDGAAAPKVSLSAAAPNLRPGAALLTLKRNTVAPIALAWASGKVAAAAPSYLQLYLDIKPARTPQADPWLQVASWASASETRTADLNVSSEDLAAHFTALRTAAGAGQMPRGADRALAYLEIAWEASEDEWVRTAAVPIIIEDNYSDSALPAPSPTNAQPYVRYDAEQSLTDDEKTQARDNIGAGTPGAGSGDVTGPASSTDGNLPSFSGTGGKTLQDSGIGAAAVSAAIAAIAGKLAAADIDTLAELNAILTDATLDDSSDPRDPNAHASTHATGGSDQLTLDQLVAGANVAFNGYRATGIGAPLDSADAARLQDVYTEVAALVSQAIAEAGTSTTEYRWTPLRVAQAIAALESVNSVAGQTGVVTISQILTALLAVDGAGSGLDADLLDGNEASAFALASHNHAGEDITSGTVAAARLGTMTGDSGAGGAKGAVPAPASGDAAAGKFLKADGTWSAPSGSGDMAAATYDPTSVAGDAFDMANMVEAADAKVMTAAERTAIAALGVLAPLDTVGTSEIDDAAVTLAKMANLAEARIIGRSDGAGTGVPTALTAAQIKTILSLAIGDVSGLQTALDAKATLYTLNAQSGTTYTLQASDSGKTVRCTNAAGCTVTVPASLGLTEPVTLLGTQGAVALTASSTTLNTESGYAPESRAAFAAIQILPTGTADTYDVIGGLAAA